MAQEVGADHEVTLKVTSLTKRFGDVVALDGFSLCARRGEIVGLVGHNGAGKTTFARIVAGLTRPTSGTVEILGKSPAPLGARLHDVVGLAPQELGLYPTATGWENLRLFGGLHGQRAKEARSIAEELAEQLLLTDVLDRRVSAMSGGQQRRLQAATAMMSRPELLLVDEPTVGADPLTRDALLRLIRRVADAGTTVVYTTHYLPELDTLDATLAVADHGRIIARGERHELLASVPGHVTVEFDGPPPLTSVPGSASRVEGRRLILTGVDCLPALVRELARGRESARHVNAITVQPPSLDDLYRQLVSP